MFGRLFKQEPSAKIITCFGRNVNRGTVLKVSNREQKGPSPKVSECEQKGTVLKF